MGSFYLSSTNGTNTSVCGKNNNWSKLGFQSPVKIGETLNIKHVDLINE